MNLDARFVISRFFNLFCLHANSCQQPFFLATLDYDRVAENGLCSVRANKRRSTQRAGIHPHRHPTLYNNLGSRKHNKKIIGGRGATTNLHWFCLRISLFFILS